MQATRAYIAGAGTAAVMLGASLAMFAMVSAFVAFGSWPGAKGASQVDQVFLRAAERPAAPQKVAVHANAVAVAGRAAVRRQVALAHTRAVKHGGAKVPAGTPVATAPSGTTGAGATNTASGSPAAAVQQPVQTASGKINDTTNSAGQKVQQGVQNLQTQVNQVVDQVTAPPPPPQGGDVVGNTVQQVQTTAGSVLGH
jgi:hypothetical protein